MNKGDSKTIATKVDLVSYTQLHAIAERYDTKIYKLLQIVVNSYLKYFSEDSCITEEVRNVVKCFADFRNVKDGFTLMEGGKDRMTVQSCICSVGKKGRTQLQPLLLRKSSDDRSIMMCMNQDEILCSFLATFAPDLIKQLRDIKKDNALFSLTDSLKFAVKEMCQPSVYDMTEDINELFSDNARSDWGKDCRFSEVTPYRRKMHKTVDSVK